MVSPMKTQEAIKLYNEAERFVKHNNPSAKLIERSNMVIERLEQLHGSNKCDEIMDKVFEAEFEPCYNLK